MREHSPHDIKVRLALCDFIRQGNADDYSHFALAEKFGYLPHLPKDRRVNIVRKIRSKIQKELGRDLVLRSRWQQQKKGGETIWLESYRTKESEYLHELNSLYGSLFEDLKSLNVTSSYEYEPANSMHIYSLFDYHLGKADGTSLDQQTETFLTSVKQLRNKTKENPDIIVLPVGQDFYHIDTLIYTTTKGTSQTANDSWQRIFRAGVVAYVKAIEYLKQFAPVHLVWVPGNHDYLSSWNLANILDAYYTSDPNVHVVGQFDSPRQYVRYGANLVMFTHGNEERPSDLPLIMAKEAKSDFGETDFHYVMTGHIHQSWLKEFVGTPVITVPSLAGSDEWHKKKGYLAFRRAQLWTFDIDGGASGYFQINKAFE